MCENIILMSYYMYVIFLVLDGNGAVDTRVCVLCGYTGDSNPKVSQKANAII